MLRRWMRLGLFLGLLPAVAVACDDGATPTTTGESAQVSLLLTDAPGEHVDNVWIEAGEIYLQGAEGEGDEEDGGREILFTASEGDDLGLVNLLELADETLVLTEDVEIPAGTYGQLRFVVESAVLESGGSFYSLNGAVPPTWNEEEDGEFVADGNLMCPSCQQSGLKVLLPQDEFPLESGQHIYVIDFDVARSFGQQAGRSGMWVMHPVMVATELGFTGSVDGTVALAEDVSIPMCPADDPDADPPVEGEEWDITVFQATATAQNLVDDEENPLTYTTSPNTEGDLSFGFLAPDTYDLGFATPVEVTDTHQLVFEATMDPGSIDVSSGSESTVSYTIDSAACEEIPTDGGDGGS